MAPIHDTDLAKDRWSKQEWRNFELWEKVENRLLKKKRLFIVFTAIIVILISSIPVLMDRNLKWNGLSILRQLGEEISMLKKDAAIQKKSYLLTFFSKPKLSAKIQTLDRCSDRNELHTERTFNLVADGQDLKHVFLDPRRADQLDLPGMVNEVCIDYLSGIYFDQKISGQIQTLAVGLVPVKDLTENRLDRVSILIIRGKNGEISFN